MTGFWRGWPLTVALLSVLIFAWGGNYTWVKVALEDSGPLTFNALRYSGAVVVIGIGLCLAGRARDLIPVRGEAGFMAMIGLLQITVMTGLTTVAMLWIEASRTVLIAYSMPIWAMIISLLVLREAITWRMVLGATLGLCGLGLLTDVVGMEWASGGTLIGSAIALTATLGWALGSVLYRLRQWRSNFWQQVFWQLCSAALTMSLIALVLESDEPITFSPEYVAIVVYNWLVPTSLGFWCWARALTRTSATAAGQFLLLSPVFGVFLSHVVLDEPLHPALLSSALLILAGAFLSLRRQSVHKTGVS